MRAARDLAQESPTLRHRTRCAVSLFLLLASFSLLAQEPAYKNPKLPAAERAHDLVSRMTLDEKASQLEDWAPAIPRLGIPDYETWNEALHGVARAGYATVFPQAIGMAATWDPKIVQAMGDVVSDEARAKFNQAQRDGNHRIFYGLTFWSPNINIFRDPRWGRGQETYGEDPYLTGRMGVAFVHGVQGDDPEHPRAIATSKHFAVHSGPEKLRHGFNVNPSERDLEETYLPAFRATVTEGHVDSVMCAYNSIDQWPACTNKMLLKEHLRDAWGFKGFVVSDCGAINDVEEGHKKAADIEHAAALSLEAGTDLSCTIWSRGFNTLANAVRKGLVPEQKVTLAAERLYTARMELGLFDPAASNPLDKTPATDIGASEHRARALQAAEESIVLLKNSGVLPFKQPPAKIAVVGPTADLLVSILGNYVGTPIHPVTPLDGMLAQFKSSKIIYAQGSTLAEGASVPVPRTAFPDGLKMEVFGTADWKGSALSVSTQPEVQADWENERPSTEVPNPDYSARWTGAISVPAAGHYEFTLEVADSFPYSPREAYRVTIDGKVLTDGYFRKSENLKHDPEWPATMPAVEDFPKNPTFTFDFPDTQLHQIQVEYSHSGDRAGGGVTLTWKAPAQAQLDEALAKVKDADVVVAFVGLSPQLEGEEMPIKIPGFDGGDRTSLDLPAPQQKLLEALASTGKPLVVVLQSGSAVALNWANQHAAAVLEAWYPGVEGGTAIARTLAGLNNPAGRLPVTFYASLEGLPDFTDYNLRGRTYRYFKGKPLWGFGYGLSYARFEYGAAKLSNSTIQAGAPLNVTVTVKNTSSMEGDEVVEAYLKTPQPNGPVYSLVGMERVHIPANSSQEVNLTIDPRSISSVDEKGQRSTLPGQYVLSIGGAQPAEASSKAEAAFTVTGFAPLPR